MVTWLGILKRARRFCSMRCFNTGSLMEEEEDGAELEVAGAALPPDELCASSDIAARQIITVRYLSIEYKGFT